jgi:hypothetical protein
MSVKHELERTIARYAARVANPHYDKLPPGYQRVMPPQPPKNAQRLMLDRD